MTATKHSFKRDREWIKWAKIAPRTFDMLDQMYMDGTSWFGAARDEGSVSRTLYRLRKRGLVEAVETATVPRTIGDGRGGPLLNPMYLYRLTPKGIEFVETVYDLMVTEISDEEHEHGGKEEAAA